MLSKLTKLWQQSAGGRLKVGSVANPCLWLTFIVLLPSAYGVIYTGGATRIFFMVLGVLPLLYFFRMYDYFMKEDPEKLRSESLEIRKEHLQIIEEKGGVALPEEAVDFIENESTSPQQKLLKNSNGGKE